MNNTWNELANDVVIKNTIESLKKNGINAELVKTRDEAKKKVLSLIPEGAEVMAMTSVSLDTINIPEEIKSGNYNSVREKLYSMDRETHGRETQKLGAAPEYAIGSVNAVTEDGKVMIASNTGSQLSAYAYGSSKVVWVVGTQKIVKNIEEGMKRIYEHSLPLESERAKKAYGVPGSSVNKILIVNKEIQQNRIHIIFVNEQLGF
ncbi:MAG: lactate utilization protein [Nanoarchaeota archaeon]